MQIFSLFFKLHWELTMINNYTRPQLLIKQVLDTLEGAYDPGMNALIMGPQFDLNRVTNPEEKAEMQGAPVAIPTSDDSVQLVPFENYQQGTTIDNDYTRLYGENLEVRLVKYGICSATNDADVDDDVDVDTTGAQWQIVSTNESDKIIAKDISGNSLNIGDRSGLHISLRGRPVTVGDIVYTTYKGQRVKRQVSGIERAMEEPDASQVEGSKLNPEISFKVASPSVTTTVSGTVTAAYTETDAVLIDYLKAGSYYNGEFSERFNVTVTTTTGKTSADLGRCSISSASGLFADNNVVITGQAGVTDFTISSPKMPGLVITADKNVNNGDGLFFGDTFGVTVTLGYNPLSATNLSIVGKYAFQEDNNIIFEVAASANDVNDPYTGVSVKVSDTSGRLDAKSYTLSRDALTDQSEYVVLGDSGLSFRFQGIIALADLYQKGLRKGDTYSLKLETGKTTGKLAIVKLNGIAGNTVGRTNTTDDLTLDCIEFRTTFTGFIPSVRNPDQWVSDSRPDIDGDANPNFGINVFTDIRVRRHDRQSAYQWVKIMNDSRYGKFYSHYKAFVPAKPEEPINFVGNTSGVAYGANLNVGGVDLGKVDIENPIGMGANLAFKAAQGRGAYVARVASDDLEGYAAELEKAEKNINVYAIAPLTDNIDVQNAVVAHVDKMSSADKKRWRRCYLGTNTPATYPVIVKDSETLLRPQATITPYAGDNVRVLDEKGSFVDLKVRAGDLFRTNFYTSGGVEVYKQYVVDRVVTNEELILKTGPANAVTLPVGYEVHKNDSVENVVDYITKRSKYFDNRRVSNIWCEGAKYNTGEDLLNINNFYIAAEVAGLRTALQPHQGLTNTELAVVSSATPMFTKYGEDNLDVIAKNGTWIVSQDYEGAPTYIRHQLTTDVDSGNLYYEDSVGVNIDEIAYAINENLGGYIGKRNADQSVVNSIYDDLFSLLVGRTTTTPGVEIGPQLVGFTGLSVSVDANIRDRINVSVSIEVPLPLNTIVVNLNATANFDDVTAGAGVDISATDSQGRLLSISSYNNN